MDWNKPVNWSRIMPFARFNTVMHQCFVKGNFSKRGQKRQQKEMTLQWNGLNEDVGLETQRRLSTTVSIVLAIAALTINNSLFLGKPSVQTIGTTNAGFN
jgi:hypothetical protein